MGTRAENKFLETYNNGLNVSDDPCYVSSYSNDGYFGDTNYLGKDSILYDNTDLTTSSGFKLDENGQYELTTDNKHIFFNHTDPNQYNACQYHSYHCQPSRLNFLVSKKILSTGTRKTPANASHDSTCNSLYLLVFYLFHHDAFLFKLDYDT